MAFNVGHEYGARIAPLYVQVSRQYYHKAKGYKEEMKQAAVFLKNREYERAAAIWKKIEATAGDNKKAAGRAAYNMAIMAELNGNLDLALDWSTKSWNTFGNKKARNYIQVIQMRQNDVRKVESQMPKKKV